jgi:dTDP-4-dehydrorhamnose reductase
MRSEGTGGRLRIVSDQVTAPTWARDVAMATARLLPRWATGDAPGGIYHCTDGGACSLFTNRSACQAQGPRWSRGEVRRHDEIDLAAGEAKLEEVRLLDVVARQRERGIAQHDPVPTEVMRRPGDREGPNVRVRA